MNIAFFSIGSLTNQKESARITLLLLAKEMKNKGHKVTIFARWKATTEPYEVVEGITIYRQDGLLPITLRKVQRQSQPFDVIHSFSATPLFALSTALTKVDKKTKLIHTLKSYSKHILGNIYWPLCIVDTITVPTQVFAQKVGIERKIHIIHSPIDLQKFAPRDKNKLKIKYGYERKKVILYYGSLWKEKGIEIMLKALPQLVVKDKSWKLIIAPRHPIPNSLKEHVQALQIEEYIEFKEEVPIEEYVAMADVVVLPYLSLQGTEGNPSCILEAMASKTAVVTSDLPELREIAEGCVRFALPGDTYSLTKEITEVLLVPQTSMIEKAFLISKNFDVKKIAEDFLKMYEL